MLSNTAVWNFSIFWDTALAKPIYFPISAAMFSMMFHRLTRTNFVYYNLVIRFNICLSVNQTSHFSNFAHFRQLQIPNARTKYYEILPTHTETPHNTNHKIAYRYFEFRYHFVTLQKNIRLLLNKGVLTSELFEIWWLEFSPYFHRKWMNAVRYRVSNSYTGAFSIIWK